MLLESFLRATQCYNNWAFRLLLYSTGQRTLKGDELNGLENHLDVCLLGLVIGSVCIVAVSTIWRV